jgi:DNA modification methylase
MKKQVAKESSVDGRRLELMPLAKLKGNPKNPKDHDVGLINQSLTRFGYAEAILLDERTQMIVAGHGRVDTLRAMKKDKQKPPAGVLEKDGDWLVLVQRGWSSKNDKEAGAYLIASNSTAEEGGWNEEAQTDLLRWLAKQGEEALLGTGYDQHDVERFIRFNSPLSADEPAEVPEGDKVWVKTGDLFELGEHRLLCGDSTSEKDVIRLMNGERAVLMATDPPYLVDYDAKGHPEAKGKRSETKDKRWDAYIDPETGAQFYKDFIRVAIEHALIKNPAIYQWHADKRRKLVDEGWAANGLLMHQTIVWVKSRPILTRGDFMWQHEPAFYGWIEGKRPSQLPPVSGEATTVWNIAGEQEGIHPTQKPVEIFGRPVQYHTLPGQICFEPFSGSGSHIIACEVAKRRCFAIDQAPQFVQAAIERWEKFSGGKAKKL